MGKFLKLLILAAGGHGQSLSEAASLAAEFEVVGFLDDAMPSGRKVIPPFLTESRSRIH